MSGYTFPPDITKIGTESLTDFFIILNLNNITNVLIDRKIVNRIIDLIIDN